MKVISISLYSFAKQLSESPHRPSSPEGENEISGNGIFMQTNGKATARTPSGNDKSDMNATSMTNPRTPYWRLSKTSRSERIGNV
jgi:hypothetical protein